MSCHLYPTYIHKNTKLISISNNRRWKSSKNYNYKNDYHTTYAGVYLEIGPGLDEVLHHLEVTLP